MDEPFDRRAPQPFLRTSPGPLARTRGEGLDPRLVQVADWLDTRFRVPGLGWKFGLDPLIGLIPWLGDVLPAILSMWFVVEGARLGLPRPTIVRMALNVALDWIIGLVPVLGDLVDFAWKANAKNLTLLEQHAGGPNLAAARRDRGFVLAVLAGLALLLAGLMALTMWLLAVVARWLVEAGAPGP